MPKASKPVCNRCLSLASRWFGVIDPVDEGLVLAHCRDDRLPAVGAVDDQLFVGVSVGGADFRLLVQRPTNGDGLTDDLVGALQRRQGLLNNYDKN